jgi:hypothetical protein
MTDWSNAERQARHRAKELARVQALEREVQALRNAAPEQVQQLVRENEALRARIAELEQALRNGSSGPQTAATVDQSDHKKLAGMAKWNNARADCAEAHADYEEARAELFREWLLDEIARNGEEDPDEAATAIDQGAATDLKDLADDWEMARGNYFKEMPPDGDERCPCPLCTGHGQAPKKVTDNGDEQRGAAGEVAATPETTDR